MRVARLSCCVGAVLLAVQSCRKEPADENVGPRKMDPGAGGAGAADAGGAADDDGGNGGAVVAGRDAGSDGGGEGTSGKDAGAMDAGGAPPSFTIPRLLAAVGECALGRYREFEGLARDLRDATAAWADDPTAATLAGAQAAYRDAIAAWQRAELFQIGPAARTPAPGALDLRDEIYFFPLGNPCLVDQQIVNQRYAEPTFATSLANARGLTAVEYLLFHDGPDNACGPAVGINSGGTWAALSATELTQRRADYSRAAAAAVFARAGALVHAWEPADGDFLSELAAPGGKSAYATEHEALEAVVGALFYVDSEVKDLKLGTPLGLTPECPNSPATCPDAVESRYARLSTEHIAENLAAFRMVFQGCGAKHVGLGFDDWLRTKPDGDELAERMLDALDAAQAAVSGLDPKLEEAILAMPPAEVLAVHAAIKALTDLFKTEMVTILMVALPPSAQGDND